MCAPGIMVVRSNKDVISTETGRGASLSQSAASAFLLLFWRSGDWCEPLLTVYSWTLGATFMRPINIQRVNTMPATKPVSEPTAGSTLYLIKEAHQALNAGMMDKSGSRPAKLLRDVRLSGSMTLYQSTAGVAIQGVYPIENFDSFTTYAVSISAGTAVLNGTQITVTTPTTPGDIYLNVNGEYSKITVKAQQCFLRLSRIRLKGFNSTPPLRRRALRLRPVGRQTLA